MHSTSDLCLGEKNIEFKFQIFPDLSEIGTCTSNLLFFDLRFLLILISGGSAGNNSIWWGFLVWIWFCEVGDDQDFFDILVEALYDAFDCNNDDDFQLTKNCERNDGRSLLANAIVGDTEVSAGVLPTNLNYDPHYDDVDDVDDDHGGGADNVGLIWYLDIHCESSHSEWG